MFIPLWLVVAVVIWFGISEKDKNSIVVLIAYVFLAVVGLVIVGAVLLFGAVAVDWWQTAVPDFVNGILFLIGLVVYIAVFTRWVIQYRKAKNSMKFY